MSQVRSEDGPLDELIQSVRVEAVVDGEEVTGELNVDDFTYIGDDAFAATLTDRDTGELIEISSVDVNAQAFPVLYVLGLLARIGIKAAIKHIGKTQIKKAAKSYGLKQSKKKWGHIMAPKHKWIKLAQSRRSKSLRLWVKPWRTANTRDTSLTCRPCTSTSIRGRRTPWWSHTQRKEVISAMVGSDSQLQLRDALAASRSGPIDRALRIAAGMSISDIHNVLEDGVAISDPELCNHFITEWIRRLGPSERLAAAVAVSHLYSTHLVEIPHAEDSSLAEILLTAKEVLDHINSELSDYHALAESPDTSFDTEFTQSMEEDVSQVLDAAARQLQGTRDELLRLIRQSSENEVG